MTQSKKYFLDTYESIFKRASNLEELEELYEIYSSPETIAEDGEASAARIRIKSSAIEEAYNKASKKLK